jgi:hypothetical protein
MNRRIFVVGLLGSTLPLSARAAPVLKVIYVGGLDCQPCTAWKNKYKADWLASPECRQVTWIEIEAPGLKEAYKERYWPGDLRPILDQLPRKSGTPRFLIVKGDKVIANAFGISQWPRIVAELRQQLA